MLMVVNMIHAVAWRAGAAVAIAEFHLRITLIGNSAYRATVKGRIHDGGRFLYHFTVAVADAINNIPVKKYQKVKHSREDNRPL